MPLLKHPCLAAAVPLLFLGAGVRAAPDGPPTVTVRPLSPAQSQALRQLNPQTRAQAPRGPGDIIPPCIIAYGYTTQGVTDRHGRLIVGQPTQIPRWTDVSAPKPPQRR